MPCRRPAGSPAIWISSQAVSDQNVSKQAHHQHQRKDGHEESPSGAPGDFPRNRFVGRTLQGSTFRRPFHGL